MLRHHLPSLATTASAQGCYCICIDMVYCVTVTKVVGSAHTDLVGGVGIDFSSQPIHNLSSPRQIQASSLRRVPRPPVVCSRCIPPSPWKLSCAATQHPRVDVTFHFLFGVSCVRSSPLTPCRIHPLSLPLSSLQSSTSSLVAVLYFIIYLMLKCSPYGSVDVYRQIQFIISLSM
jgi:hypothetical protein